MRTSPSLLLLALFGATLSAEFTSNAEAHEGAARQERHRLSAADDADGDGYSSADGDCDDADDAVYDGAAELPDGKDNDCDDEIDEGTSVHDDDGDGYSEVDGDCDDDDADISPDAVEVAENGLDDDCDGTQNESTSVYDDDGDGYSEVDGDCDDADDGVSPGADEVEDNAVDDDCDGDLDEGAAGEGGCDSSTGEDCAEGEPLGDSGVDEGKGGCACASAPTPGLGATVGTWLAALAIGWSARRRQRA